MGEVAPNVVFTKTGRTECGSMAKGFSSLTDVTKNELTKLN
jgi:hypothetical protein